LPTVETCCSSDRSSDCSSTLIADIIRDNAKNILELNGMVEIDDMFG
jgi:hypothetical protein